MATSDMTPPRRIARHTRRKTAENWDDDFDFDLPSRPKVSSSSTDIKTATGQSSAAASGRASPADSFSSWDDSPPKHSVLTIPKATLKTSLARPNIPPPRHSPSESVSLPSSLSVTSPGSSQLHQPLITPTSAPPPHVKTTGPNGGTVTRKLVKRHPSASFTQLAHSDHSASSLNSKIVRSPSSEKMPPPPVPKFRQASLARPGLRMSPSSDRIRQGDGKTGFWRRFSGMPAPPRDMEDNRRRRSSSVGTPSPTKPLPQEVRPPLPPMPPNLRSASQTSATSESSFVSHDTGISASSSKSGVFGGLASILRRSASSLSRQSDRSASGRKPPSAYPAPVPSGFSSISPAASRSSLREQLPLSPSTRSLSRGFHLPSPSPGSPYKEQKSAPSLPQSNSFHTVPYSDSEIETDLEDVNATPRRRRKIRPVSAQPASQAHSRGWDGEGWMGFAEQSHRRDQRSAVHQIAASDISIPPSPSTTGFASTTASTLRRLGSMSTKHGRRLSGGFKFGGSTDAKKSLPLETVTGSPSKPDVPESDVRKLDTPPSGDDFRRAISDEPTAKRLSINKLPPGTAKTVGRASGTPISSSSLDLKKDKERRRQSWNDFVIPKNVLDKQREIKENINAVKKFAGGIESLKGLVVTRDHIRDHVLRTGIGNDIVEFQQLEEEFAQWWEMATVLIEVGSTGSTPETQASLSAQPSPARSRRITLASDEAKDAADALRRVSSQMQRDHVQRSASLPDPEVDLELLASASKDPNDQWRASTGRQDLSNRQLEVLRTMLQTPVHSRPSFARNGSTLSPATCREQSVQTPVDRLSPSVKFPDTPESGFISSSLSIPSPATASGLADPRPTLKERRSSKAGLVGLKDFLKSLNRPSGSARVSPLPQSTPFEGSAHSAGRASISAGASLPALEPLRRSNSPQKSGKRPNIRNIFRTSSGNWSDLVRGQSSGLVPPVPTRPSIDSTFERKGIPPSVSAPVFDSSAAKKTSKAARRSSRLAPSAVKSSFDDDQDMVNMPTKPETEMTVRPHRKSRILGLGMPSSPSSPSSPRRQPPPAVPPTPSESAMPTASKDRDTADYFVGSGVANSTVETDVVIALTPENLPVLLDYVRQCEGRLGQWKDKAEVIGA